MFEYVCVSGYGWSGSGACIDLLKEFDKFGAPEGEFRIAKDPHGLSDLEFSLVHSWDFIRNDVAIRDFLNYCDMLGRNTGLIKRVGKGFSEKLDVDFMLLSENYINELTNMTYYGDTFVHRYNISSVKSFITKIRSKLGKNNAKKMYYSRPSEDKFLLETNNYLNNIFTNYANNNRLKYVVLDQAIPPANIIKTMSYYNPSKLIIIDRDPRDIYCNMIRGNGLLGSDLIEEDSAVKYIKWHTLMRKTSQYDKNTDNISRKVLRLNFEDLILDYESSIVKIFDFIGASVNHSKKYELFNPETSLKNIGLWKKYYNQEVMDEIASTIPKYCIDV
jgi:hypothetical protein